MQVLSLMIDKAIVHNAIAGFQVHAQGTPVSHLEFADDTLFGTNLSQVQMLKGILIAFEV